MIFAFSISVTLKVSLAAARNIGRTISAFSRTMLSLPKADKIFTAVADAADWLVMQKVMLCACQHFQIVQTVIEPIAVFVMNDQMRWDWTSKHRFGH